MELLPDFTLLRPETVDAAVQARAENPGAKLIGGGTDLIPNMRRGLVEADVLIDVSRLPAMRELELDEAGLRIGAAVTLEELASHGSTAAHYPAIAEAAGAVAGPTHRVMGTVGGNLCLDTRCYFYNQSEWWRASNAYCLKYGGEICHVVPTSKRCYAAYSGDLAPGLLIYDAEAELAGPNGTRRVPLADIFVDDGMAHLGLAEDEMLVAVHVPPMSAGLTSTYAKIRMRGSIDFPLAGVAIALRKDGENLDELRVALTGTNSQPVRLGTADQFSGQPFDAAAEATLTKLIQKQSSPVRTSLAQPQYRRRAISAMAVAKVKELIAG